MGIMKRRASCTVVVLVALFLLSPSPAAAGGIPLTKVGVTAGIGLANATPPVKRFFRATFDFEYTGGIVTFSANEDGTGNTRVDDVAIIRVGNNKLVLDYSEGCIFPTEKPPVNITDLFTLGTNEVQVTLMDKCEVVVESTSLWITTSAP
jgi:hypothetical protein